MRGRQTDTPEWSKPAVAVNDERGRELRSEYIAALAAAMRDRRNLPAVNRARTAYQRWLSRSGRDAAAELARCRQEALR